MQNPYVLGVGAFAQAAAQSVVGAAKHQAGEQLFAPAVAGERPGFAHQGPDYVPVVDVRLAFVVQARQALHQPIAVIDFQLFGIQSDRDPLPDEPRWQRVGPVTVIVLHRRTRAVSVV